MLDHAYVVIHARQGKASVKLSARAVCGGVLRARENAARTRTLPCLDADDGGSTSAHGPSCCADLLFEALSYYSALSTACKGDGRERSMWKEEHRGAEAEEKVDSSCEKPEVPNIHKD